MFSDLDMILELLGGFFAAVGLLVFVLVVLEDDLNARQAGQPRAPWTARVRAWWASIGPGK